jgi:RES domain-containing protein
MGPNLARVDLRNTHGLIPSRYPPVGLFDEVASPEDLELLFELESWTNDWISAELGVIQNIPRNEWVTGRPQATVIMAAFCHPVPKGARFSGPDRGAWYAAFDLAAAQSEIIYHRGKELREVGVSDARLEMREYVADFRNDFHDIRPNDRRFRQYYDPDSCTASQTFARRLFESGFNGERSPPRRPMHRLLPAPASAKCSPGSSLPISVARRAGTHHHKTCIIETSRTPHTRDRPKRRLVTLLRPMGVKH